MEEISSKFLNERMEMTMAKFGFIAALLLVSGTGAYAAAPGMVGKAVASCCSIFAACCEAAIACCS